MSKAAIISMVIGGILLIGVAVLYLTGAFEKKYPVGHVFITTGKPPQKGEWLLSETDSLTQQKAYIKIR